jgi:adenylosuccinate synthase
MEGWMSETGALRTFERLPRQAQAYVRKVEELVGVPVTMVSIGPGRDETIPVSG